MIDESKHHFWTGKIISCNKCGHKVSINDYILYDNKCAWCGNPIRIDKTFYNIIDNPVNAIKGPEEVESDVE